MNKKTKKVAKKIKKIHQSGQLPEDDTLDALLGLKMDKVEKKVSHGDLLIQYGVKHRTYQGDISYFYIQRFFERLAPFNPQSILDLGSGYGRVLFYGAMLWEDVDFYGMEMVPERVKASNKWSKKQGLDSIECFQGDATKKKDALPAVDCICIMNTFFPYVLPKALKRLKHHARKHPFLLVTISTGNLLIAKQKWLKEIYSDTPPENEFDFRFFRPKKYISQGKEPACLRKRH